MSGSTMEVSSLTLDAPQPPDIAKVRSLESDESATTDDTSNAGMSAFEIDGVEVVEIYPIDEEEPVCDEVQALDTSNEVPTEVTDQVKDKTKKGKTKNGGAKPRDGMKKRLSRFHLFPKKVKKTHTDKSLPTDESSIDASTVASSDVSTKKEAPSAVDSVLVKAKDEPKDETVAGEPALDLGVVEIDCEEANIDKHSEAPRDVPVVGKEESSIDEYIEVDGSPLEKEETVELEEEAFAVGEDLTLLDEEEQDKYAVLEEEVQKDDALVSKEGTNDEITDETELVELSKGAEDEQTGEEVQLAEPSTVIDEDKSDESESIEATDVVEEQPTGDAKGEETAPRDGVLIYRAVPASDVIFFPPSLRKAYEQEKAEATESPEVIQEDVDTASEPIDEHSSAGKRKGEEEARSEAVQETGAIVNDDAEKLAPKETPKSTKRRNMLASLIKATSKKFAPNTMSLANDLNVEKTDSVNETAIPLPKKPEIAPEVEFDVEKPVPVFEKVTPLLEEPEIEDDTLDVAEEDPESSEVTQKEPVPTEAVEGKPTVIEEPKEEKKEFRDNPAVAEAPEKPFGCGLSRTSAEDVDVDDDDSSLVEDSSIVKTDSRISGKGYRVKPMNVPNAAETRLSQMIDKLLDRCECGRRSDELNFCNIKVEDQNVDDEIGSGLPLEDSDTFREMMYDDDTFPTYNDDTATFDDTIRDGDTLETLEDTIEDINKAMSILKRHANRLGVSEGELMNKIREEQKRREADRMTDPH